MFASSSMTIAVSVPTNTPSQGTVSVEIIMIKIRAIMNSIKYDLSIASLSGWIGHLQLKPTEQRHVHKSSTQEPQ